MDSWIVDSGATCHMYHDKKQFVEFISLEPPQEVTLGNGFSVEATGCGVVRLKMTLTDDKTKKCKLNDVLYVPQLSYNLLSVSKATQLGKKVKFTEDTCDITDVNQKLIATATKEGSLYYVNCRESDQRKGEVFQKFLEWKAMAEKSTGRQLKVLRTDNGGEYTSSEFQDFLKKEGIRHELTVPKTPEQNGVAE
ncbi:hypothetical protein QQF64_012044 [Cirrhinus molitorella]|uniref:Integrase catalytic domain-containing protein n=1 Tax=Cirrhinus molitorella TaxID=172907 RepID=A0ABR3LXT7_9TELE